jgi:large subunit ribosomal protein L24
MREAIKKIYKIRIKKDDIVVVTVGKDKGKTGKVLRVHPSNNKATVEGVNIATVHKKKTTNSPGAIIQVTKPLDVSKIAYLDEKNKPSRIGYKIKADGTKVRIVKTTGKEIK